MADDQGEGVAVVELQWRRLREMKMLKERRWGVAIFEGKEEEEARQFHSAGCGG
jgi:hypothetical protein